MPEPSSIVPAAIGLLMVGALAWMRVVRDSDRGYRRWPIRESDSGRLMGDPGSARVCGFFPSVAHFLSSPRKLFDLAVDLRGVADDQRGGHGPRDDPAGRARIAHPLSAIGAALAA